MPSRAATLAARPGDALWTDGRSLLSYGRKIAWHADDTKTRHTRVREDALTGPDADLRTLTHYREMCAYFNGYHIGVTYK